MKRGRKLHYAWVAFGCCIALKLGVAGVVGCLSGNFVTPVVRDLGCPVSQFTLFVSVEAAAMALMYTTASKVLTTRRIGLVMGTASAVQAAAIALMATYRSAVMFSVSGAFLGLASAFTGFVAIPLVINMWFREKVGMVLGLIMAAGNVATVGYSLLSGRLIDRFGWRSAYLILAAIAFIITVPAAFLLLKSPEELHCEPYGKSVSRREETLEQGLTRSQAVRRPVFYVVWFVCILYSVSNGVAGYIATFSTMELGQSIAFGARASMCVQLGCIGCSAVLGYVNDRFGVQAGLIWGTVFSCAGYFVMLASFKQPTMVLAAALLVGLGGSMYTVQSPLLVRDVLGSRDYPSIWALIMMGNSLAGAFSYSPIGLFYDIGGSYRGAFICAIVLFLLALCLGFLAGAHKRHLQDFCRQAD